MSRKLVVIDDVQGKNFKDEFKIENGGAPVVNCAPRAGFVTIMDKDSGEYLIKDKPCDFGGTGKNNLIVWNGREIIPQILFNQDRVLDSGQRDLKIRWLSLGVGGADATNVLEAVSPLSEDVELINEYVIDVNDVDYADGGKKKRFDNQLITYEQDPENGNRYLVVKVTTTIKYTDALGADLSEFALWFSNGDTPQTATIFELFARVSMSTIRKCEDRELIILWYIYF